MWNVPEFIDLLEQSELTGLQWFVNSYLELELN